MLFWNKSKNEKSFLHWAVYTDGGDSEKWQGRVKALQAAFSSASGKNKQTEG